jgi:hypothetical protein
MGVSSIRNEFPALYRLILVARGYQVTRFNTKNLNPDLYFSHVQGI